MARRWPYRALAGWLILGAVLLVLWWTAPPITPPSSGAEDLSGEELLEARVVRVSTEPTAAPGHSPRRIVHLEILSESLRGEAITIELLPEGRSPGVLQYRAGDRVIVSHLPAATDCVGQPDTARARDGRSCSEIRSVPPFVIDDFARRVPLLALGVVFVIALALVAGWQGLRSLAGLVCALGVLRWFVVPHILAGREPLLIALIGCVLIVAVALPLTQSDFVQVVAAGLGLLGGVVVAGGLSVLFVSAARIGGWGTSEELLLVQALTGGVVSVRGLLLAGMLIGAIGALIDAAAGQASSVFELHAADRTAPLWTVVSPRDERRAGSHRRDGEYAGDRLRRGLAAGHCAPDTLSRGDRRRLEPRGHRRGDRPLARGEPGHLGGCPAHDLGRGSHLPVAGVRPPP